MSETPTMAASTPTIADSATIRDITGTALTLAKKLTVLKVLKCFAGNGAVAAPETKDDTASDARNCKLGRIRV
jgi:hypothetical protein